MIEQEDKIKLFTNEINDINDKHLKTFATKLIINADDYFFIVPASSSGKYHPTFDLGDGGLVRHTRCVIFMAKTIADSYCLSDYDRDCLIVAALAHDIKKQGNGETKHTVWEHPILAAEYVQKIYEEIHSEVPQHIIEKIKNAIKSHMGKWGHLPEYNKGRTQLPLPNTEFEKILQASDYIASRNEILGFKFRETEEVKIGSNTKTSIKPINQMSLIELENYQMPFGKHKGKTLKEIKSTGYLDWMIEQTDFSNRYTQDVVREYFNKLRESVTSSTKEKIKEENRNYIMEAKSGPVIVDTADLPF